MSGTAMRKLLAVAIVALDCLTLPAMAHEQTVTLSVENMYCAACPYIVKEKLAAVQGVIGVAVSYEDKTAVVTFDDDKADVAALVKATTDAGYPSAPRS
jgi:mercuric ion binding protein